MLLVFLAHAEFMADAILAKHDGILALRWSNFKSIIA
jgi:hypothetical protein